MAEKHRKLGGGCGSGSDASAEAAAVEGMGMPPEVLLRFKQYKVRVLLFTVMQSSLP